MNTYIAITRKIDNRYISSVLRAGKYDNLLSVLKIKGIYIAQICSSKKKAQELARFWNDCHKNNGTYLYQD